MAVAEDGTWVPEDPHHGSQSCPHCGGYVAPMGVLSGAGWAGPRSYGTCRDCGISTTQEHKNKLGDFLTATAADYS